MVRAHVRRSSGAIDPQYPVYPRHEQALLQYERPVDKLIRKLRGMIADRLLQV